MGEKIFDKTDLLTLYIFFEGSGSRDKALMISIVSPLLALISSIIGYMFLEFHKLVENPSFIDFDSYIIILSVVLLFCIFLTYVVWRFLIHAEDNYRKADLVGQKLREITSAEAQSFEWTSYRREKKNLFAIDNKNSMLRPRSFEKIGSVFIFFLYSSFAPIIAIVFLLLTLCW